MLLGSKARRIMWIQLRWKRHDAQAAIDLGGHRFGIPLDDAVEICCAHIWFSQDGIGFSRIKGKAGWQIIAAVRSRPENCRSVKVQAIQVSEEGAVAYLAGWQASGIPPMAASGLILPSNRL
ncbi:hypothetical protein [Parasphingorhabdus sp.]|uniref:hypothetical protein n=1 Tax=Parasphingorhabdus sp. TaxID=2709688 RepID=UPI0032ED3FAF